MYVQFYLVATCLGSEFNTDSLYGTRNPSKLSNDLRKYINSEEEFSTIKKKFLDIQIQNIVIPEHYLDDLTGKLMFKPVKFAIDSSLMLFIYGWFMNTFNTCNKTNKSNIKLSIANLYAIKIKFDKLCVTKLNMTIDKSTLNDLYDFVKNQNKVKISKTYTFDYKLRKKIKIFKQNNGLIFLDDFFDSFDGKLLLNPIYNTDPLLSYRLENIMKNVTYDKENDIYSTKVHNEKPVPINYCKFNDSLAKRVRTLIEILGDLGKFLPELDGYNAFKFDPDSNEINLETILIKSEKLRLLQKNIVKPKILKHQPFYDFEYLNTDEHPCHKNSDEIRDFLNENSLSKVSQKTFKNELKL